MSRNASFALVVNGGRSNDLRTGKVSFPYDDGGFKGPNGIVLSRDASFALVTIVGATRSMS